MPRIERLLSTLAKQQQCLWRCLGQADQRLGPNEIAGRPEQGMAALHRAKFDRFGPVHPLAQKRRFRVLDTRTVDPEAPLADDQAKRYRVEPEDQRPLLHHDMKQMVEITRFQPGKDRLVDGCHRSRLAAGKGEQILAGLLGRFRPGTKPRKRMILEGEELSHEGSVGARRLTSSAYVTPLLQEGHQALSG